MARAILLALLCAAPGPAAFRAVAVRAEPSLVHLVAPGGKTATGVLLGAGGQVVSVAALGEAGPMVAVRADGTTLAAQILRRDAQRGLVLLQLPVGQYTAAAARKARPRAGEWVVAVALGERGAVPAAGLFVGSDARHPGLAIAETPTLPGAGLFALDGALVGIALGPAPGHRAEIFPIDALRSWLQMPAGTE